VWEHVQSAIRIGARPEHRQEARADRAEDLQVVERERERDRLRRAPGREDERGGPVLEPEVRRDPLPPAQQPLDAERAELALRPMPPDQLRIGPEEESERSAGILGRGADGRLVRERDATQVVEGAEPAEVDLLPREEVAVERAEREDLRGEELAQPPDLIPTD